MSDSFYDAVVILFFTAFPILLILLHIFLSSRKRMVFGFVIPILWTVLGVWMVMKAVSFAVEMGLLFGVGLIILLAILFFIRKKKQKKK